MTSDTIGKILTDLPTIQKIARRPLEKNPLLALVIEQHRALTEIAEWARQAQVQASVVRAPAPDLPKPVPEEEAPA